MTACASPWRRSWRADPAAVVLADRHYSRQKPGTPQFVQPGRCLALLAADRSALWVTSWPFPEYVKHEWAGAWVNSWFRKEGPGLASEMIRHAVAHTIAEWPHPPPQGMVTMVDAAKIAAKPGRYRTRGVGWCYLKAGFRHVGFTKSGLYVFQMLPAEMPEAEPVPGSQPSLFGEVAS